MLTVKIVIVISVVTEPCDPLSEDPWSVSLSAIPPLPRPGPHTGHLPPPPDQHPEEDLPPPPPPHRHAGILHSPGQTVQEAAGAH